MWEIAAKLAIRAALLGCVIGAFNSLSEANWGILWEYFRELSFVALGYTSRPDIVQMVDKLLEAS